MVPLRSASGEVLGIVSVDEPVTGRRPAQVELELLSAVAAHVAIAVEQAQSAAEGRRHRAAVEHLLRVSSQLTGRNSAEEMLDAVCDGIREALGFQKVMVFLADHPGGHLVPLSGVGFTAEQVAGFPPFPLDVLPPLLDPAFLSHGCVVMDAAEAQLRTPPDDPRHLLLGQQRPRAARLEPSLARRARCTTATAGSSAWSGWTTPRTALLPTDGELQALRAFANQAMSAIESARQLDSLRHLAAHDPLTGLRNRRGFEPGIDAHLDALGSGGELSLLVVDLDHFKRVNDTLGHDAGDDVLRRFADVLRTASGDGDVPTRLGGEEFALVLPGAGEARALAVAEHLRLLVRNQFATFPCPVSVSVGVASRGAEARDASELMRAANRALYAAKRLGRDRCVVHHAQTLEMLDALRDVEGAGAEQLAAAMLLAETLDLRDVATARHSETVGRYSEQIARELQFELARVERIRAAGILHDIGKLGIADAVLHKPGRPGRARVGRDQAPSPRSARGSSSTPTCATSAAGCSPTTSGWTAAATRRACPADAIPVEARILAVADAYEAMTADRPYRQALPLEAGARGAAPRRRHAVRRRRSSRSSSASSTAPRRRFRRPCRPPRS